MLNILEYICDRRLRNVCLAIPSDWRFQSWPASLSHHHAYEGGLRTHTGEVWDYAHDTIKKWYPGWDMSVLAAACLWHDYLKVEEYVLVDEANEGERSIEANDKKLWVRNLNCVSAHHIIEGAERFRQAAEVEGVHPAAIDAVEHCILSHHGPVKEWGSPVAPNSLEALILHQADMLSAHYGRTK